MGLDIHTVDVIPGGTPPYQPDRILFAMFPNMITPVGASAGAAVSINVAMKLPATYIVEATPNQDATVFVTNKTPAGFTVTLNPRLAANTLAAGTVDLTIFA